MTKTSENDDKLVTQHLPHTEIFACPHANWVQKKNSYTSFLYPHKVVLFHSWRVLFKRCWLILSMNFFLYHLSFLLANIMRAWVLDNCLIASIKYIYIFWHFIEVQTKSHIHGINLISSTPFFDASIWKLNVSVEKETSKKLKEEFIP